MKTSITLTSLILALAAALIVDPKKHYVCSPEDPSDCYPQVFEPTSEWQQIREGQDIPPGLHVRLNIDTLVKEAKLLDASEGGTESHELAVATAENVSEEEPASDPKGYFNAQEEIRQKVAQFKASKDKTRVSESDLQDYDSALEEVLGFQNGGDDDRLDRALETLVELSHDIEFGAKLTGSQAVFESMLHTARTIDSALLREKLYRVMGASLRNNKEAISNVLEKQSRSFVEQLFRELQLSTNNDVIKKRILGVVLALSANEGFRFQYFNVHHGDESLSTGILELMEVFPSLHSDSKARVVNIFEDANLLTEDAGGKVRFDKRSIEERVIPDNRVSSYLQGALSRGHVSSEKQFKHFFNKLVELHAANRDLKPSGDFMVWLSEEVETRRQKLKKKDQLYSDTDEVFDGEMMKARHEVFGNPNAHRKFVDEL